MALHPTLNTIFQVVITILQINNGMGNLMKCEKFEDKRTLINGQAQDSSWIDIPPHLVSTVEELKYFSVHKYNASTARKCETRPDRILLSLDQREGYNLTEEKEKQRQRWYSYPMWEEQKSTTKFTFSGLLENKGQLLSGKFYCLRSISDNHIELEVCPPTCNNYPSSKTVCIPTCCGINAFFDYWNNTCHQRLGIPTWNYFGLYKSPEEEYAVEDQQNDLDLVFLRRNLKHNCVKIKKSPYTTVVESEKDPETGRKDVGFLKRFLVDGRMMRQTEDGKTWVEMDLPPGQFCIQRMTVYDLPWDLDRELYQVLFVCDDGKSSGTYFTLFIGCKIFAFLVFVIIIL